MASVGLFILIGSQFVACSLEAMATKTLFDVVSKQVCRDEGLYQRVRANCSSPVREALEKNYEQLLQDYIRVHASDLWKLFAEQVDLSGAHTRTVTVSAFLNPNCAVTGCAEGRLCFWDFTKSTAPLFFVQGHDDGILALVVIPQDFQKNPVFATGSKDKTVRLWELQDQTLVLKWVIGIEGEITRITCNNAGTCVAIAVKAQQDYVYSVLLVKAATGERTQVLSTVLPCALCFAADDSKLIVVGSRETREIDVATAATQVIMTDKPESITATFSQGELCSIGRGVLRRGTYEQPLSVATCQTLCVAAYSGPAWEVITHGGLYNSGHVIVNRRDTLLVPLPGFVKTTAIMGGFILFGGMNGALVLVRLSNLLDTLTLQQAHALFSYGLTCDEAKEALQFMQAFLGADKLPDGGLMQKHLRRLPRGIIPFIEREYKIDLPKSQEEGTSSRRVHALSERELIFEQFLRLDHSSLSPKTSKRK